MIFYKRLRSTPSSSTDRIFNEEAADINNSAALFLKSILLFHMQGNEAILEKVIIASLKKAFYNGWHIFSY